MRVWVVSECVKWEGKQVLCVLSDEGLDKYLIDHPRFKKEEGPELSYSDFTLGDLEWHDIVPWLVDAPGRLAVS